MELGDTPGNYRPVSLTSLAGKVLKTAAGDQVKGCLEKHGLIKASLADVVLGTGRSCLRNLLKFFEAIRARTVFKEHSEAQEPCVCSAPHRPFRDARGTRPTPGPGCSRARNHYQNSRK